MKQILLLLAGILCLSAASLAQGTLKGKLVDSATQSAEKFMVAGTCHHV